jgi:hypothetical protein
MHHKDRVTRTPLKLTLNIMLQRCSRDRKVVGFMQSVPINTNVVSSNPGQGKCTRYNIV